MLKNTQAIQTGYKSVRSQTMRIVAPLEIEDYVIQTAPFMSPPRWHIGHTSWFFEMLLKEYSPKYKIYSEDFLFYFNSYYDKFGVRIERAKRGTKSRPTVSETVKYRDFIDEAMLEFLSNLANHPKCNEILELVQLGLEHEMQHQELLVYDIKHLLCDIYKTPINKENSLEGKKVIGMAQVEGGLFWLGDKESKFAFDNERPSHQVYLQDFAIDLAMVNNTEFLEFILAGGYQDPSLWYAEGWNLLNQEKWQAPLYWEFIENEWYIRDYHGLHKVLDKANYPVSHVNFHEASAFAKWRGKRLPTEAEWEKAACFSQELKENTLFPWGNNSPDILTANLFENNLWDVSPIGAFPLGISSYGCHQMIGDLWEWTTSDYAPYPGFKPYFNEYTDKWFISQKVLRGGSYATAQSHIRTTYRNYFYPQERWMLVGFRCAKTL
ncbi:MAG: ergothioneine biosynthesis protein EgtB [Acidobacteria bacterium]|nr:ergothioneine biosynthesis protein EgtB [Acidobacteriota bacterium]